MTSSWRIIFSSTSSINFILEQIYISHFLTKQSTQYYLLVVVREEPGSSCWEPYRNWDGILASIRKCKHRSELNNAMFHSSSDKYVSNTDKKQSICTVTFKMITSLSAEIILKYCWIDLQHDFPRYWPLVRGIHRSPLNSPHKGQWLGALMFSLIRAWTNGSVSNRDIGDPRRHRAHYDVTIMLRLGCGEAITLMVFCGSNPSSIPLTSTLV